MKGACNGCRKTGETSQLDIYQLSFVQKTQEIFYNARKASGGKNERPTSNIERPTSNGKTPTLGILGTLAHFRHFSGLSGLG